MVTMATLTVVAFDGGDDAIPSVISTFVKRPTVEPSGSLVDAKEGGVTGSRYRVRSTPGCHPPH